MFDIFDKESLLSKISNMQHISSLAPSFRDCCILDDGESPLTIELYFAAPNGPNTKLEVCLPRHMFYISQHPLVGDKLVEEVKIALLMGEIPRENMSPWTRINWFKPSLIGKYGKYLFSDEYELSEYEQALLDHPLILSEEPGEGTLGPILKQRRFKDSRPHVYQPRLQFREFEYKECDLVRTSNAAYRLQQIEYFNN